MENCQKFEGKFGKFGKEWELIDDLFSHLEFIWAFHGYTEKDVDKVWWLQFWDYHTKYNKVIDMSEFLPKNKPLH